MKIFSIEKVQDQPCSISRGLNLAFSGSSQADSMRLWNRLLYAYFLKLKMAKMQQSRESSSILSPCQTSWMLSAQVPSRWHPSGSHAVICHDSERRVWKILLEEQKENLYGAVWALVEAGWWEDCFWTTDWPEETCHCVVRPWADTEKGSAAGPLDTWTVYITVVILRLRKYFVRAGSRASLQLSG